MGSECVLCSPQAQGEDWSDEEEIDAPHRRQDWSDMYGDWIQEASAGQTAPPAPAPAPDSAPAPDAAQAPDPDPDSTPPPDPDRLEIRVTDHFKIPCSMEVSVDDSGSETEHQTIMRHRGAPDHHPRSRPHLAPTIQALEAGNQELAEFLVETNAHERALELEQEALTARQSWNSKVHGTEHQTITEAQTKDAAAPSSLVMEDKERGASGAPSNERKRWRYILRKTFKAGEEEAQACAEEEAHVPTRKDENSSGSERVTQPPTPAPLTAARGSVHPAPAPKDETSSGSETPSVARLTKAPRRLQLLTPAPPAPPTTARGLVANRSHLIGPARAPAPTPAPKPFPWPFSYPAPAPASASAPAPAPAPVSARP